MKKAQGISINTIIIAAIALIVLVVLIAIFTGRLGTWGQELSKKEQATCSNLGGSCKTVTDGNCPENYARVYGATDCKDDGKLCCAASGE